MAFINSLQNHFNLHSYLPGSPFDIKKLSYFLIFVLWEIKAGLSGKSLGDEAGVGGPSQWSSTVLCKTSPNIILKGTVIVPSDSSYGLKDYQHNTDQSTPK